MTKMKARHGKRLLHVLLAVVLVMLLATGLALSVIGVNLMRDLDTATLQSSVRLWIGLSTVMLATLSVSLCLFAFVVCAKFLQRRETQDDYAALFHEMLEAVILVDQIYDNRGEFRELRVLSTNPAFQTVFGVGISDVVNTVLAASIPSIAISVFDSVLQVGVTGHHIRRCLHDDILERDFDITVFSLGGAKFAVIASDVTERCNAERALQESRRQYTSLIANIPGIVYRCKFEKTWPVEFMSDGSMEVLGYTPDDFYSGRIAYRQLVDERFRAPAAAIWKDVLAEQGVFRMEYEITTKRGEKKWVVERGTGVYDSKGRIVALEGLVLDVTERRNAELERENFAMALEQSRDTIVITNENGVILYVNSAIQALSGYDKKEAIGTIMPTFESPPIDSDLYHSMWKTLYKGETWESNFPGCHKDGTPYTENVVISPVMDEKGKVVNFVAIRHDVTRELQAISERNSLREQLNQANKMESIGRLAGGVAHDFNNMLQAILGHCEMALAQTSTEGQVHADLLSIQGAARRAADLTRQLLIFARKSKSEPKIIGISRAIENLSSLLKRVIGSEVLFELNPPQEEFNVRVDPTLFDQVIANLCINARDAVAQKVDGKIVLSVRLRTLPAAMKTLLGELPLGDYIELSVTDNGCGITNENMTHIFEPFFSTKGKGKGVGLGLSTAYGVVKSCNGGIIVKSKVNEGTSFELLFPRAIENINESESVALLAKNLMPKAKRNDEIILLVDDEETILYTTRRMLESLGYQVLSTTSALEGIELAKLHGSKLSLLLSDVIMPELNGTEMIRQILSHVPSLPYLYMSGYTANLLFEHGLAKQTVDVINKPFTRADLAKKVRECLDGCRPSLASGKVV